MNSSQPIDAQGRITLRAAQFVRRVGNVGTLIGVLFSIAAVVRLVTLPINQRDLIPIGLLVIGFGLVFAFLSRVVSRAFVRPTVVSFLEKHGSEISVSVRQEFEALNLVPADFVWAAAASQPVTSRSAEPTHPVDSLLQSDGAIEVVFRQQDQTFRVLFGDASCRETVDAAEPWRLDFGVRRKNRSEISYDHLDVLIQSSPYLRFRLDHVGRFREPDEWSRGDSYCVSGEPAEISIGLYLHEPAESVELQWVMETEMSLGRLAIRLEDPGSRKT